VQKVRKYSIPRTCPPQGTPDRAIEEGQPPTVLISILPKDSVTAVIGYLKAKRPIRMAENVERKLRNFCGPQIVGEALTAFRLWAAMVVRASIENKKNGGQAIGSVTLHRLHGVPSVVTAPLAGSQPARACDSRGARRNPAKRCKGPPLVGHLSAAAPASLACKGSNLAMTGSQALPAVLERIDRDLDASLERLFALLRIQSISTDPAYAAQCRVAAEHVASDLASIGFDTGVRPTQGHPVVVGRNAEPRRNGKGPSVLFYGHYDVQPVDPLDLWRSPPFEPHLESLEGGRKIIVARGACDDKGQAMTFVEACRAFKAVTGTLPLDITMLIEGEEECGSKHLFDFVRDNSAALRRDLALVCDTGMWDADTPSITTSLRGLVYEEIRLTAADRDLHSGLFGGAARNPLHVLADILAALHEADGSVAIAGFYEGVPELPPDIKADLAALDFTPEKFLAPVGLKIPAGERDRMLIELVSTRPTAEVNGIIGGYTGEGAKTVIPAKATAKVSFRLVGAQDPEKIRANFRAFVRARVPVDCHVEFGNFTSAPAFSVAFDNPALAKARTALAEEWGKKAVTVGAGGSIPIVGDFKTVLGMDTLMVGFALDDDRVHSPNEKYDLKCFHKGIRSWARILAGLAQ
jgi:acetylornithine deacetylase/succinyl-diaminopimelate desuccinylase-like protein